MTKKTKQNKTKQVENKELTLADMTKLLHEKKNKETQKLPKYLNY